MPRIVASSPVRVVDHDGLTIDELAGNVATDEDLMSVAFVRVECPTSEPWITVDYDEWICVRRGRIEIHHGDGEDDDHSVLHVDAGSTCFIAKGERFRPVFPEGGTEYIPVCIPAFRPDRCKREEGPDASDVSKRLNDLHGGNNSAAELPETTEESSHDDVERLYHMCQKDLWEAAVSSGEAYYPPTFERDGRFTHATAVPHRLIETANHFYRDTKGAWICLELSRSALRRVGIVTKFEANMPVGSTDVSKDWNWICPHIYGGLPTMPECKVVTKLFPMVRNENGTFLTINGLCDDTVSNND